MVLPLGALTSLTGGGGLSASSSATATSGDVKSATNIGQNFEFNPPALKSTANLGLIVGGILGVALLFFALRRGK